MVVCSVVYELNEISSYNNVYDLTYNNYIIEMGIISFESQSPPLYSFIILLLLFILFLVFPYYYYYY